MKKIISVAAAAVTMFAAFAAGASAMTPAIPEYENYIFIANDGFFRLDNDKGEARSMLDVTPRNMYIIGDYMYLVAEREVVGENGEPKWIDTLCRFNMDGTGAVVLSGDDNVDEFRMNGGSYYYTTYDADTQTGRIVFGESGAPDVSLRGEVMDIDWNKRAAFSYITVTDGDNPHREVIVTDIDSGEETTVTEDFDYPGYIYNNCVNGYLYSKTYYGNTARLYRRSASAPERELILEDFLDYWLSDDGKTVYYKTQDEHTVSLWKYDTETKEKKEILTGADYLYMSDDHVHAFRGNKNEKYSLDGELLNSVELHMAEEDILKLTIDSDIMLVNDVKRTLDSPPVIKNDRTMLPIRAVAESIGGTVVWDEKARTVTVEKGNRGVIITIGFDTALVNGNSIELDSPAYIENGRTMLPLRFVTEHLGCGVTWDEAARSVTIVSAIE